MKELHRGIYLDTKLSSKYKSNMIVVKFITPYSVSSASKRSLLGRMIEDGSISIKNKSILEQRLANLYGSNLGISVQRNGNFLEFTMSSSLVRPALIKELSPDLMQEWFSLIFSLIFEQSFEETNDLVKNRFNREKQLLLTRFKRRKDVKTNLLSQRLLEEIYQKDSTKYLDGIGDSVTLQDLELADVRAEYRRLLDESLILIAVHGEFDEELLANTISNWPLLPREVAYNYTDNQINLSSPMCNQFVQEIEGKQSHLAMAYHFPFINTLQGRVHMQMLNAIFGGLSNSLLFMEIREAQGLAYSIYSSIDFSRSLLVVFAAVDGEKIEHVINEVNRQMVLLRNKVTNLEFLEEIKFTLISEHIQSRDYQDTELYLQINQFLQPTFPTAIEAYQEYVESVQAKDLLELIDELQAITSFILKGGDSNA